MNARPAFAGRMPQRGVTLIELMVGLTLGLIVAVALLLLFANASSAGQNLTRSSTHIENGRYVSELLRDDIRLAGYFGETPDAPTPVVYTDPSPCLTIPTGFDNAPFGLPAAVQGFKPTDNVACLDHRKVGTSALAVRRLAIDTTAAANVSAGQQQYFIQYSFCSTDPASTALIFNKASAAFTLKNRACNAANPVRAYVSRVYFIADCNVCSGAATDSVPTLKRLDLVGNQLVLTALAEGVEALRFEYGFDTAGNGSPGTYLNDTAAPGTAGATAFWSNVMTVKAHFIVRSLEKVSGSPSTAAAGAFVLGNVATADDPGDGYVRSVYSSTIRLVNPSGARE